MQPTSTSTSTSTFTPAATALPSAYTSSVATASSAAPTPSPPLLPRELPLFPVQPVGVFLPGACGCRGWGAAAHSTQASWLRCQ